MSSGKKSTAYKRIISIHRPTATLESQLGILSITELEKTSKKERNSIDGDNSRKLNNAAIRVQESLRTEKQVETNATEPNKGKNTQRECSEIVSESVGKYNTKDANSTFPVARRQHVWENEPFPNTNRPSFSRDFRQSRDRSFTNEDLYRSAIAQPEPVTGDRRSGDVGDVINSEILTLRKRLKQILSRVNRAAERVNVSNPHKPRHLQAIENFIAEEFELLGIQGQECGEGRLRVYAVVMDQLTEDFSIYGPLLADIKREYSTALERSLAAQTELAELAIMTEKANVEKMAELEERLYADQKAVMAEEDVSAERHRLDLASLAQALKRETEKNRALELQFQRMLEMPAGSLATAVEPGSTDLLQADSASDPYIANALREGGMSAIGDLADSGMRGIRTSPPPDAPRSDTSLSRARNLNSVMSITSATGGNTQARLQQLNFELFRRNALVNKLMMDLKERPTKEDLLDMNTRIDELRATLREKEHTLQRTTHQLSRKTDEVKELEGKRSELMAAAKTRALEMGKDLVGKNGLDFLWEEAIETNSDLTKMGDNMIREIFKSGQADGDNSQSDDDRDDLPGGGASARRRGKGKNDAKDKVKDNDKGQKGLLDDILFWSEEFGDVLTDPTKSMSLNHRKIRAVFMLRRAVTVRARSLKQLQEKDLKIQEAMAKNVELQRLLDERDDDVARLEDSVDTLTKQIAALKLVNDELQGEIDDACHERDVKIAHQAEELDNLKLELEQKRSEFREHSRKLMDQVSSLETILREKDWAMSKMEEESKRAHRYFEERMQSYEALVSAKQSELEEKSNALEVSKRNSSIRRVSTILPPRAAALAMALDSPISENETLSDGRKSVRIGRKSVEVVLDRIEDQVEERTSPRTPVGSRRLDPNPPRSPRVAALEEEPVASTPRKSVDLSRRVTVIRETQAAAAFQAERQHLMGALSEMEDQVRQLMEEKSMYVDALKQNKDNLQADLQKTRDELKSLQDWRKQEQWERVKWEHQQRQALLKVMKDAGLDPLEAAFTALSAPMPPPDQTETSPPPKPMRTQSLLSMEGLRPIPASIENRIVALEQNLKQLYAKAGASTGQLPGASPAIRGPEDVIAKLDRMESWVAADPPDTSFNLSPRMAHREFRPRVESRLLQLLKEPSDKCVLKPLVWLVRTIQQMYDDKFMADVCTYRADGIPDPFPEFVLDWMSRRFGIKKLVEQACRDLQHSVEAYRMQNNDVFLFSDFMTESFSEEHMSFFLFCRTMLVDRELQSVSSQDVVASKVIPMARASDIVAHVFEGMGPEVRSSVQQEVFQEGRGGPSGELIIDAVKFLHLCTHRFQKEQEGFWERLVARFLSADTDHNSHITLDEFASIMSEIVPKWDSARVQRAYRNCTVDSRMGQLSLESFQAFLRTGHMFMHHAVIPTLLSDNTMPGPATQTVSPLQNSQLRHVLSIVTNHWTSFEPTFIKNWMSKLERTIRLANPNTSSSSSMHKLTATLPAMPARTRITRKPSQLQSQTHQQQHSASTMPLPGTYLHSASSV